MRNPDRPSIDHLPPDAFFTASDGAKLFSYVKDPKTDSRVTVYIISGYTGINHDSEKDVIDLVCDGANRIAVLHPRGTGYSEGKRGDVKSFSRFLDDFSEFIRADIEKRRHADKVILYGHSISTAMALEIGTRISCINGAILINPPYLMKKAPGMTPSVLDYAKYACHLIFFPHRPIVNMAGDPDMIANEEERTEARARSNDHLLVKYISMYMMLKSKILLDKMLKNAERSQFPLLLVYGTHDSIIEKKGCELLFDSWKHPRKEFYLVENGPHGKPTVIMAMRKILAWIGSLPDRDSQPAYHPRYPLIPNS
jgi:alpha-beta hydrolase superfamily lysophospholipase